MGASALGNVIGVLSFLMLGIFIRSVYCTLYTGLFFCCGLHGMLPYAHIAVTKSCRECILFGGLLLGIGFDRIHLVTLIPILYATNSILFLE